MIDSDVALITGAASGMGASTLRMLRERGQPIVALDLAEPPSDLRDGDVTWVLGDVAQPDTWDRALEASRNAYERTPGALSLGAGIVKVGTVTDATVDDFRRSFEVNVIGTVLGLQACLPGMVERGRGSIVTIGSIDSFTVEQELAPYCATKGAVLQLTRSVAVDYAHHGIRANCVCPGATDTPLHRGHLEAASDPEALEAAFAARVPLGRLMDPDEIATVILFLLSDASSAVTGATHVVDAGLTASFHYATPTQAAQA